MEVTIRKKVNRVWVTVNYVTSDSTFNMTPSQLREYEHNLLNGVRYETEPTVR